MDLDYTLVTGSLAFDYIMDYPGVFADHIDPKKIHILNLSFLVDTFKKMRGGTAGNIAYSLALLNNPVAILSSVGDDFFDYEQFLNNSGVDTSSIRKFPGINTAMAMIMTDKKDNQITAFSAGAMNVHKSLKISGLKRRPKFVVIAPANPRSMVSLAKECRQLNIPYMFDPGMQLPRLTNKGLLEGLMGAEILISNDYEIGLLKKRLNITERKLLRLVKVLVITLGEKGSQVKNTSLEVEVKAAKVRQVVDPTGAGDAYRAGFLAGFLRKLDLATCAKVGSVASCYAIEKYGTTNHKFTSKEFTGRFERNYHQKLNLLSVI